MENTNTVSISLVDVLSTMLGKRIVMSGEDYVEFETKKGVNSELINEAISTQAKKRLEEEKIKASNDRKNLGIDYTNILGDVYKVSLTNDDANGLIQVKTAFEMGITETNFYFENGTVVPLKSVDDLLHLGQFISIERNKFFL